MAEYLATAQVKVEGDFRPLERQLRAFKAKVKATVEGTKGAGSGGALGVAGGAALGAAGGAAAVGGVGRAGKMPNIPTFPKFEKLPFAEANKGVADLSSKLANASRESSRLGKNLLEAFQKANPGITMSNTVIQKTADGIWSVTKATDNMKESMVRAGVSIRQALKNNAVAEYQKNIARATASISALDGKMIKLKTTIVSAFKTHGPVALQKSLNALAVSARVATSAFKALGRTALVAFSFARAAAGTLWSGIKMGASGAFKVLGAGFGLISKAVTGAWNMVKGFGRWLRSAFLVTAIAVAAALKLMSKAMGELESEANLKAVLQATGGAAGFTADEMKKMAGELSGVTNFTSDAITKGQSLLATFNQIKGVNFKRAQEAMLDMSQVFGQDIKSSSVQLGKALQDPIKGMNAMARVGVSFSKSQQDAIKNFIKQNDLLSAQNMILAAVEGQVGGAAKAAANPITIMKNAFGELLKRVGFFLNDLFGINDGFKKATAYVNGLIARFDAFRKTAAYIFVINKIRAGAKLLWAIMKAVGVIAVAIAKPIYQLMKLIVSGWVELFKLFYDFFNWVIPEATVFGTAMDDVAKAFKEFKEVTDKGELPEFFEGTAKGVGEVTDEVDELKKSLNALSGAESIWESLLSGFSKMMGDKKTEEGIVRMPDRPRINFGDFGRARNEGDLVGKAVEEQTDILHGDLIALNGNLYKATSVFA